MTPTVTMAATKPYTQLRQMTNFFEMKSSQKSVSNIKKTIRLTTDRKSVVSSSRLNQFMDKIISNLPTEDHHMSVEIMKKNLDNITENILKVNKLFSDVNSILFLSEGDVVVDDKNMALFLNNMKEVKGKLEYISDYLSLTIDCQKSKIAIKSGKAKRYTLDDINSLFAA